LRHLPGISLRPARCCCLYPTYHLLPVITFGALRNASCLQAHWTGHLPRTALSFVCRFGTGWNCRLRYVCLPPLLRCCHAVHLPTTAPADVNVLGDAGSDGFAVNFGYVPVPFSSGYLSSPADMRFRGPLPALYPTSAILVLRLHTPALGSFFFDYPVAGVRGGVTCGICCRPCLLRCFCKAARYHPTYLPPGFGEVCLLRCLDFLCFRGTAQAFQAFPGAVHKIPFARASHGVHSAWVLPAVYTLAVQLTCLPLLWRSCNNVPVHRLQPGIIRRAALRLFVCLCAGHGGAASRAGNSHFS